MATPITDLVGVLRRIFRFARYLGFVFLAVTLVLIVREVISAFEAVSRIHPALAWLFVALLTILFVRLLGVPVYRFLRMPPAVSPPVLPDKAQDWTGDDVEARAEFLALTLAGLRRNPALAERRDEIGAAADDLAAIRSEAPGGDPAAARARVIAFERERIDPLLRPLDAEVDRLIRAEALSVGVATAISPNGTLDAFVVLWRNANLVSRIANVYYGKPGVRGSLRILRDVSGAALLATYLEGLTDAAGNVMMGILGSFAGVVAGPVVDGGINAIATLRIGYLAKARCRSFRAWTDATRRQAVLAALGAAKNASRDVLAGIAKRAGGGVMDITGKIGDAVKGGLSGLVRKIRGEEAEAGGEPA